MFASRAGVAGAEQTSGSGNTDAEETSGVGTFGDEEPAVGTAVSP